MESTQTQALERGYQVGQKPPPKPKPIQAIRNATQVAPRYGRDPRASREALSDRLAGHFGKTVGLIDGPQRLELEP